MVIKKLHGHSAIVEEGYYAAGVFGFGLEIGIVSFLWIQTNRFGQKIERRIN
jgi:hypothetical protein